MTELCHDYFLIDLKPSNHTLTKENPHLTETLERDWLRVSADITSAFNLQSSLQGDFGRSPQKTSA